MSDPLRILSCQSLENLKIIKSYIFCSNNCLGHFQVHLKATWKSIMTICLSSRNYMFYNTKSLLGFSGRPEIDLKVFEKHIFHNEICSGPTWKSIMTIRVSSRSCMFYNTNSFRSFSDRPEIDLKVFEKHVFHNEICSGPTWKPTMTIRASSRNCMFYNTNSLRGFSGRPEIDLKVFEGLRQQRAYAGSLFIVFVA